ncbi:hypothetical protein GCM10027598_61400 [Amycolatopsis oliviviridis]|uniref:Uncharacterized protein n=1 Tax=Amycolatopsis oliviviridis TaxID=1471590 RepID=A0ABQ3M5Y1_9PSEU|nr:hypothetical protein GCM10017790_69700 [Amycolatopsis oliviviridis]
MLDGDERGEGDFPALHERMVPFTSGLAVRGGDSGSEASRKPRSGRPGVPNVAFATSAKTGERSVREGWRQGSVVKATFTTFNVVKVAFTTSEADMHASEHETFCFTPQ